MPWWFVVIAVLWIAISVAGRARKKARRNPTPTLRISPVVQSAPQPPAVHPSAPAPENVLQPFSPIPLTVVGASSEALAALRGILGSESAYGRERHDRIMNWLLTTNARVKEIDAFLAEWGPRYEAATQRIAKANPEWERAGELDRKDILDGAAEEALASLAVHVRDLDYDAVSAPPTLEPTADDTLLDRYGFETLSAYLRFAGSAGQVIQVRSDDYYRPRFEMLLEKGLARRGIDIPPEAILGTMRVKDMEQLSEGVEHRRFTRRVGAIEFLTTLPDLRERLGKRVALREFFQVLPLPTEFSSIDVSALSRAWAYAAEYAKLLDATYSTAASANRVASRASIDEHAKGWIVESLYSGDGCCPTCDRQSGTKRGARSVPRLPHHVGCVCQLSQIYE